MPRKPNAPLPQPVFGEPAFSEGVATPDPTAFKTAHPSDTQQYKQIQNLLTKDVVGFDPSRAKPGDLYALQDAWGPHGPEIVQRITQAGQIVFHCAGDTGASNAGKYKNEVRLSDQVTADFHTAAAASQPAFFYHLGDVVYDFGESQYYYDQFYEPFRNYPAPIFAVPGNHDSFVIPGTAPGKTPLTTFTRNFCALKPAITAEAASLHRTAMTQPGVYFTLDAPFVRIIGLFSNALEDPGVISSEGGKWPGVPDLQLAYLTAQLQRIKTEKYAGAVLLVSHHPPFTYAPPPKKGGSGGNHSSSSTMLREIDTICQAQGVYPHAYLSGHAHNYQRYTRTVHFGGSDFDVPFIVCGSGGHNVNPLVQAKSGQPAQEPANGSQVGYLDPTPAVQAKGLLLEHYDGTNYGYLRVQVNKSQLQIGFHQVGASLAQSRVDMVTVDLASHTMVSN
ncbi:MAG TPA: metallophosphoesterase [Terriglobia bacterium]|nr:metallophosphoesterase [Terriglobia bacterium]